MLMENMPLHTFHIPVMGLGFTIDTPVKVAHFGISSVISIMEDGLLEDMRKQYSKRYQLPFIPISEKQDDFRAKRITAYLNLVHYLVVQNTEALRKQPFEAGMDITKYFELLPDDSEWKIKYLHMQATPDGVDKVSLQNELRSAIVAGSIDVNIMSKVDKTNFSKDGTPLPAAYSDAMSALRGFAHSNLESSVVFSAGYNPRLYASIETYDDFYVKENGILKKKIILKVSDYRSAVTQGKLLAKKGLWISEFRIESGLNCGGHAFATDGLLLGPILEAFKLNRVALEQELLGLCNSALALQGKQLFDTPPPTRITVQGGIGTSLENTFLLNYYKTNGTGWGSPFLLVPEATQVDAVTLNQLVQAKPDDYFLSHASPLGIPFNNFRKSSAEQQRLDRISKGKPGSPCFRKFLSSNTEFTHKPICTASRQYQHYKIRQIKEQELPTGEKERKIKEVTDKDCLCVGLSSSAVLNHHIDKKNQSKAVTICPGPNLAYFSGVFSLKQMVDHIYGRTNILNSVPRSNMFINELALYVDYLKKEIDKNIDSLNTSKVRYLKTFQANLLEGVNYYRIRKEVFFKEVDGYKNAMSEELNTWEAIIKNMFIPAVTEVTI